MSSRLFVTKVPVDCSANELKAYFGAFGKMVDFHVPWNYHRTEALHKGIAFVSYEDRATAQTVCEAPLGHWIKGNKMVVDYAAARDPQQEAQTKIDGMWSTVVSAIYEGGAMKGGGHASAQKGKGKGKGSSPYGSREPSSSMSTSSSVENPTRGIETNRVFVTKISSTLTHDNLHQYFSQFGKLKDLYMPLAVPNSGLPHKGIAFISFEDPSVADTVLQTSSCYEIKSRKFVVVAHATNKAGSQTQRSSQPFQRNSQPFQSHSQAPVQRNSQAPVQPHDDGANKAWTDDDWMVSELTKIWSEPSLPASELTSNEDCGETSLADWVSNLKPEAY